MGRVSVRTASTSANSKAGVEQQIELPSGKYGRIPEPSSALLRRAESPANPVLPKQTVTKAFPATMRERMPLTSSLTGAGRAGKPGCLTGNKGSRYVGEVLAGRPHGKGQYFAPAAQPGKPLRLVYSGDFVKGFRDGQGTAFYNNGEVYTGTWQHNRRVGYGELTHVDGSGYKGMWNDDKQHGVGSCYSSSGDIFVGTFVNGKKHGLGTTYMPRRGKKYIAEYVNGTAECGAFHDLADHEVEAPPTADLRDMINSSALQQAVAGEQPVQLPPLLLMQPSKVLAKEFTAVRKQRSKCGMPGDSTLQADTISLLRHAFILIAGGDDVSCSILPHQLQELVVLAGLDPAAPEVVKLLALLQQKAAANANNAVRNSSNSSSSRGSSDAGCLFVDDLMHVVCFFREKALFDEQTTSSALAHSLEPADAEVVEKDDADAEEGADSMIEEQLDDVEQWQPDEGHEESLAVTEHQAEGFDTWGAATETDMLERHIAQHKGLPAES